MSEYFFGLHSGHLTKRADKIAERYDAWHVNYTEPRGERRGWFCCLNRGNPHDQNIASAVMADIEKAGGFEALMMKKDKREQEWD